MEYKVLRIKDIANINKRSYNSKLNWNSVKYLDTGNITNNIIDTIVEYNMENEKLPSRAKRIPIKESIIYSTVRPNQKHFGILKEVPENLLVSTGFAVIDSNKDIVFPEYLFYFLSQDIITEYLQKIAEDSVSTYPAIKPSVIGNLEIILPALQTQFRTTKILSALDQKIEVNNKIISNLESQAQAIFKSWFIDFEPFQDGEFVDSELGMIPRGWEVKELKDIVIYNKRGFAPKYSKNNKGIPVINQRCIRNNTIIEEAVQFHDPDQKKVPIEKFYNEYDVLINSMGVGTLGRVSQVSNVTENKIVHSCITILRNNQDIIEPAIFGQMIINKEEIFKNMGHGTTGQTSLKNKDLDKLKFVIAPINIQEDIEKFLKINIKMRDNLYFQNQKLAETRDTLLPKLMSGEIDVSNIKIDIEEDNND